jgi:DNA-directed RNA polymerase subunit E"
MNVRACRKCRKIIEEDDVKTEADKKKRSVIKECPVCQSQIFTTFWKGYVLVIDPEKSEVAKSMDVKLPGRYALRLSR